MKINDNIAFGTAVRIHFPAGYPKNPPPGLFATSDIAKDFAIRKGLVAADAVATDIRPYALVMDDAQKTTFDTAHLEYTNAIDKYNIQNNNLIERAVEVLRARMDKQPENIKTSAKATEYINYLNKLKSKDYSFYYAKLPEGIENAIKKISNAFKKQNDNEFEIAKKNYNSVLSDLNRTAKEYTYSE